MKSRYKRTKMGCLPGDVSKGSKAKMLEGKSDSLGAKSYRKDFQKKANRRFRHNAKKEIEFTLTEFKLTKHFLAEAALELWAVDPKTGLPKNGEIICLLLYNWRDDGKFDRYSDGLSKEEFYKIRLKDIEDRREEPLHVLWKKGNEYRRAFIYWWEPAIFEKLRTNVPQLSLGDKINDGIEIYKGSKS